MNKILEDSLLYDFYGELLTERQRSIYEDVRFADMSLSEATETYGISRQGIHDTIHRTEQSLRAYEEKLGLVQKFLVTREIAGRIRLLCEKMEAEQNLSGIPEIKKLLTTIEE